MNARLKKLGLVLAALGLIFMAGGAFAFTKVQAGADSLQAFSGVQNVALTYDDNGNLTSHGSADEGAAILAMLKDDWKYPVNMSDLNPKDPVVNTGTEYMYQMAMISYHTLHGSVTFTLPEGSADTTYDGTVYHAGDTVTFVNDGKYWTGFDRNNPIEATARNLLWTGTAHALIAELGVGSVTASTLQMGYGLSVLIVGIGGTFVLAGLGLVWAAAGVAAADEKAKPVVKAKAKAKS